MSFDNKIVPERAKSPPYLFYAARFPVDATGRFLAPDPSIGGLMYDALRAKFPEHFNLDVINKHFMTLVEATDHFDRQSHAVYYVFDKLKYRASYSNLETFTRNNKVWTALDIKLSNDGFLYPRLGDGVTASHTGIDRHRNILNWAKLQHNDVRMFPALVQFCANRLLQKNEPDSKLSFVVFYHEAAKRLDFKAYHDDSSRAISICFEEGYPQDKFDDEWAEEFSQEEIKDIIAKKV